MVSGLNLLPILQLFLYRTAATTAFSITPSHDRSVAQNGSKSNVSGLDLLHVFQLSLHITTVTTKVAAHAK